MTTLDKVISLRNEGMSWVEMGRELNMHPEKVRSYYRRVVTTQEFQISDPPVEEQDAIIDENIETIDARIFFENKKQVNPPNWRELLDHAARGKELNEAMSVTQEDATVFIETDSPVGIVYTGDWHLGDSAVDYQSWREDIRHIMDNPMLKMAVMGDANQNMRSFKVLSGVLNQVLSPTQQGQFMRNLTDELTEKGKILAWMGGNHDTDFDERIFGEALHKYLFGKMKAPIFANRGILTIKVGTPDNYQTYTNLMFHKSRFRSFMRPTHGAYREWQMSFPAEIVAGAHDHVPGLEQFWGYDWPNRLGESYGGHVVLVKIGTYQKSEFGFRFFHNGGYPIMPTVVLHPDEHKKVAFTNMNDAEKYLNFYKE